MSSAIDPRQRLLQEAVTEFSRATGFPVTFGGYASEGVTAVTAMSGAHGEGLLRLRVANSRGLGGRAMVEHRPRFTRDYMASRNISHDYDAEIGSESIVMLVAVPVVVNDETRAVLYGGTRGGFSPDGTFMRAAAAVRRDLVREILAADEGDLLGERSHQLDTELHPSVLPGPVLEELRSSHAEVRRIAAETTDPVARARLAALEARLAGIGHDPLPQVDVHLTAREVDVLSQAAIGATNAEIGATFGIAESTVKSYLKTAMGKLESSTRHAAVAAARGRGLIP